LLLCGGRFEYLYRVALRVIGGDEK
jgi:hypothetical protein